MGNNGFGNFNQERLLNNNPYLRRLNHTGARKEIFAVRNPVFIKKQTLTLEKDGMDKNKYYIKFNYDAELDFNVYINFEVSLNSSRKNSPASNHENNKSYVPWYKPSANFDSKKIEIKSVKSGQDQEFFEEKAYLDYEFFNRNRKIDREDLNVFDLSIEIVPIFKQNSPDFSSNNEVIIATLCIIEPEEYDGKLSLYCEHQKLRTNEMWIEIQDVFNAALEEGDCNICCSNVRNTIFLPCRHACACEDCAQNLKMRGNACPICKAKIQDLLVIDGGKCDDSKEDDVEENMDNINNSQNNEYNISSEPLAIPIQDRE